MSGLRAARHAPSRHAVTGPARQIRPQLVRAAVLPTLAAALSGAAAVIFTLQLGGGAGERDARLWPVLTGCALLVVGALAAALLGAQRAAKAVRDRCEALRRSSVRGRQELRTAADRLERGETPPRPVRGGAGAPALGADPAGVDEFWLLSQELRGAREQAHAVLVRVGGPVAPSDSERKVEVFVNLARRLQSLVHREISLLDDLEDTVEDPDLLKELFHVDHLATRIRRHAENLAVLGGAASRRQWTRPIDLSEVLRSSVAEVEQYTRVKVVPPAGGSVRGHAVADVVHLLAELVENATVFSAPDTDVVLRAERVTAGIAVEVEDRGLGMPAEEQHRMNALLGDPDQISVRHLLADGRIGLFVVSALARRHGIAVELKSNIYGGVLAVLVLPQELLGAEAPSAADAAGGSRATSWGTGGPPPPPLEPVRMPAPAPPPGTRQPAAPGLGPLPGHRPPSPHTDPAPPYGTPTPTGGPAPAPGHGDPAPSYGAPAPAGGRAPAPENADSVPPYGTPAPAGGPAPVPGNVDPAPAYGSPDPAGGRAAAPGHAEPATPYGAPAPTGGRAPVPGNVDSAPAYGSPDPAGGRAAAPGHAELATPYGAPDPRRGPVPAPASVPGPRPAPPAEPGTPYGPATPPGAKAPQAGGPTRGAAPGPGAPWAGGPTPEAAPATATRNGLLPEAGPRGGELIEAVPAPARQAEPATGPGRADGPGAAARPAARPGPAAGPTGADGLGAGVRPGPGAGAPTGTRPPLPKRRAQTHLAPQLRDAPAPRRTPDTEQPVHDPGLMAAFQRGFGLAQSENQV